jgi:inosine-uridine nucleoside N-ribohydrolase
MKEPSIPSVILDCDPGHDDAIAIMLAAQFTRLLGITTVSGNAPVELTTRNALIVTQLLGIDVPVHQGAAHPLTAPERHAASVHGQSGLDGPVLPALQRTPASHDAVDFIIEATAREAGVWLVATGPLTNIAHALERDPLLTARVAGISIMGGSAREGNVTAAAEFNVWADPEAADIVFARGMAIRMCGLNLTRQLLTDEALAERLQRRSDPVARFASAMLDFLHSRMEALRGDHRAALHDPCAVLAVTHPQLFVFRPRHVRVELAGELTRGMTVVDERASRAAPAPNAEVAYEIDAPLAMELVVSAIRAHAQPLGS